MEAPFTTNSDDDMRNDWKKLASSENKTLVSCHNREGMLIIETFQPHFWDVESPTGESIAKNWNDAELRQKALERTQQHYTKIYKSEIRRNLAFFSKAPLPTVYRPILTKGIVAYCKAKNVLDCSVGWGGRLLGTLSHKDTHFTGIEPFTKTYKGLQDMAKFCGVSDRATLLMEGAEDALPKLQSKSYDLVITSPPYFDLEVYSHEETQSVKKFPTWDSWCENFLEKVIRECLRCLKDDGTSAWSVKNMKKQKLKDKVFEYHEKYGWECKEVVGMSATPRNTGGKAKITEETFLFKKKSPTV